MDEYYKLLAAMPDEIRAIAEKVWDYTGRPAVEYPMTSASIELLKLCNTFDEYKTKYAQLFPKTDMGDYKIKDRLVQDWMLYMAGMNRCADALLKRNQG